MVPVPVELPESIHTPGNPLVMLCKLTLKVSFSSGNESSVDAIDMVVLSVFLEMVAVAGLDDRICA